MRKIATNGKWTDAAGKTAPSVPVSVSVLAERHELPYGNDCAGRLPDVHRVCESCAYGAEHHAAPVFFLEAQPKLCEEMYKIMISLTGLLFFQSPYQQPLFTTC